MALTEKNRAIKDGVESLVASMGIAKVGYAPVGGIPLHGEVRREGHGLTQAISME